MRFRIRNLIARLKERWYQFRNPPEPIDTLKELARFRKAEDQMERITKLLKCQPDEMQARLNKILAHISEMSKIVGTAHVHTLIEKIHKDCTKHDGVACKRCEKCLNNECEKCQAVDWLRVDLGLPPLLSKDKHEGEGC